MSKLYILLVLSAYACVTAVLTTCKKFFLVKRILLFLFFFKIAHVCVQNINKQGLLGVILLWTQNIFSLSGVFILE